MKFSNKISNIKLSPIRKLAPLVKNVEKRGINVIHLNIGQPDIDTPREFLEAVNSLNINILDYAPSEGLHKTLETTQLYLHNYGLDFGLGEIVITSGASEALIFSIMILCDPDDEVITIEPYYPNYSSFCEMSSAKLVGIETKLEEGFKLPEIHEFEKVINSKTKAILLSNPGNPTGRVYTKEEVEIIVEVAKKHDLFIIADEVYREFNFTDREFVSFADYKEVEDRVILIDSISKKYSACGARIGSIASKNKEFMTHVIKLAQARLAVSTLDQIGAGAMDIVDDQFVYDNRKIYKDRRNVLEEELKKITGIEYSEPEGAFYMIVKLPFEDAENFIIWMLENVEIDGNTVLLTPAESFYTRDGMGKNQARISYCVSEEEIKKACRIIQKSIDNYPKRIK